MKNFISDYLHRLNEREKQRVTLVLTFLILLFMFLLSFFSSRGIGNLPGDSGTVDEVAHIPSGYSYMEYGDFRLNPEHPPLAKAIAGIPLALSGDIKGIKDNWSWDGINQWESGWYILYQAGNDPARVFALARFPMMLLMLVLGYFLFKWATELYGRKVGLTVLLLYSFYPDVIAHGRLVTTDIAAALGYVITIYYFDRALRERSTKNSVVAGLAFGIAQLLKFSSFLLFGILLFLILVRAFLERKDFWAKLWSYFKIYFWVCLISLILVWAVYIPFVWNTPVDIEHKLIEMNLTSDPRTQLFRNFLHLFEGNPILRGLGHYLLGVMLVFARVAGGNATYALGQVSDKSISWYFPFAWSVKTPITIIVLFLATLIMVVGNWTKNRTEGKWQLWLLFMPWLVYWAFTLKGSLNIGIRHLMPTVPFVLLLIGYLVHYLYAKKNTKLLLSFGALVVFMIVSTLSYFPSYIGYFNEFVPRDQRYNYLIDSSLDWGQDLLRLKKYVDDNNIKEIKVDYFGGSVPAFYIPQSTEWHSSYGPTSGWLAVSATYYQSSKLYGPKEGKWSYSWLDDYKPETQIGGSILVFNIKPDQLRQKPPQSTYPITKMEYPGQINIDKRKVGL